MMEWIRLAGKKISLGAAGCAAICLMFTPPLTWAAFPQAPQAHLPLVPGVGNDPKVEWVDAGAAFIHLTNGLLRIKPCDGHIARITYSPGGRIPDLGNPVMADSACATAPFTVLDSDKWVVIVTANMKIAV